MYQLDLCELCGAYDELSHNEATGMALCLLCDMDNPEEEVRDFLPNLLSLEPKASLPE